MNNPTYEELLSQLHHRTVVIRQIREYCAKRPELLEISKLTGQAFCMGFDEYDLAYILDKLKAEASRSQPYPEVGSVWQDIKTKKLYRVLHAGKHTETNEPLVVYQGAFDNIPTDPDDAWCRPLLMWYEKFVEVRHYRWHDR